MWTVLLCVAWMVARELPGVRGRWAGMGRGLGARVVYLVVDGVVGAGEVDVAHSAGTAVGVGVVPEGAALLSHLERRRQGGWFAETMLDVAMVMGRNARFIRCLESLESFEELCGLGEDRTVAGDVYERLLPAVRVLRIFLTIR